MFQAAIFRFIKLAWSYTNTARDYKGTNKEGTISDCSMGLRLGSEKELV